MSARKFLKSLSCISYLFSREETAIFFLDCWARWCFVFSRYACPPTVLAHFDEQNRPEPYFPSCIFLQVSHLNPCVLTLDDACDVLPFLWFAISSGCSNPSQGLARETMEFGNVRVFILCNSSRCLAVLADLSHLLASRGLHRHRWLRSYNTTFSRWLLHVCCAVRSVPPLAVHSLFLELLDVFLINIALLSTKLILCMYHIIEQI